MARTRKVRPRNGGADLSPEEKATLKAAAERRRDEATAKVAAAKSTISGFNKSTTHAERVKAINAAGAADKELKTAEQKLAKLSGVSAPPPVAPPPVAPPPVAPPPVVTNPLLDETVPTSPREIAPVISSIPAAPVTPPPSPVITAPAPLHAPLPLLRPASEPTILKPESKFVFVTMWTDRGQDHQSNCAGSASMGKTETLVNKWVEKCKALNCNYWAVEQDDKDLPDFILFALEKCAGKAVVFVDYDVQIRSYPVIFDRPDIDFMTTAYNIDPRFVRNPHDLGQDVLGLPKTRKGRKFGSSRPQKVCFDPYALQPTGDVYYFANTVGSRELLQSWSQSIGLNLEKDEHDVLSMAFNAFKFGLPLAYIQLPSEYLALIENPNAILKHTDCLPGNTEVPDYYSTLTEVECNRPPTKFYNALENDDGALKSYLDYAKSKDLYKVVPALSSGLPKALVVDKAITQIREFIKGEGYRFTEDPKYRKRFDGISAYDDIEVILPEKPTPPGLTYKVANVPIGEHTIVKLTGSVKDGVFNLAPAGRKFGGAPQKGVSFEFAIKNSKKAGVFGQPNPDGSYGTRPQIENLDFIAVNTSDDDLHPEFDLSKPYFMSKTMQSVIDLCSTKEELSGIFGKSHQVLAKIRCLWIHND